MGPGNPTFGRPLARRFSNCRPRLARSRADPKHYTQLENALPFVNVEELHAFVSLVQGIAAYDVIRHTDGVYAKGLANGAESNQEPGDRGYGRTAGFIDQNGNQWWLNDPENIEG